MKPWILCLLMSSAVPTMAANIYVAPVQGTNINDKELETVRELLKVQVQNEKDSNLVSNIKEADSYIQTKLIKFKTYTLSMARWQGNKKVASGQWRAENLQGLETTIGSAVPEILSNTQPSGGSAVLFKREKSLGEQAQEKQQEGSFERVEAGRQVMIGFGPAYFNKLNASEAGLGFQAGFFWNINDHFDLGLQTDFSISTEHTDAFLLNGKIVTNYFFMRKDISPFLGGGFGYGWASVHDGNIATISDDTAGGFALSLQAGVKFFRTSDVNFALSTEYTTIFDKSSIGRPGVFLLRAALYY